MALPEVLPFEDLPGDVPGSRRTRECFYRKVATRAPRKGEWYVSGAVPMAYRAFNDLSSAYLVVVPTHRARKSNEWIKGEAVLL